MKSSLLIFAALITTILVSNESLAASLEKSRLRSDNSYLDVQQNIFVYRDNVIYEHGNMTIHADSLTKQGEQGGTITALGNPVKIHYIDENGETTDIDAPKIIYRQQTAELTASGNIIIIQSSGTDVLTLSGDQLKANQAIAEGFSFILNGNPTEFRLQQPNQANIIANADQLRSNGKDKQTEMVGNVKLQQGDSNMTAAFLTYDGTSKVISAGKNQSGDQRVETEFFWEQEKKSIESSSQQPSDIIDTNNQSDISQQPEKEKLQ